MKRICSFLAIAFAVFAFGGCSKDDTRGKDDDRKTWVAFSINSAKPHTYADVDAGLDAESKINTLDVVIFKDNGDFEKVATFSNLGSTNQTDPISITMGEKYFLVFVNASTEIRNYLNTQSSSSAPDNKSVFVDKAANLGASDDIINYANAANGGSFMMTNTDYDVNKQVTYFSSSDAAKTSPIEFKVKRLVAKVELATAESIKNTGIGSDGVVKSIEVQLYSQNKSSYLFEKFQDKVNGLISNPNYNSNTENASSSYFIPDSPLWSSAATLVENSIGTSNVFTNAFYCFENSNPIEKQRKNNTTHLILRVKFQPSNITSNSYYYQGGVYSATKPSGNSSYYENGYMYYHLYFKHDESLAPNNQQYMLVRNNWYKIILSTIYAPGDANFIVPSSSAIQADGNISFQLKVEDWNVISRTVTI